MVEDVLVPHYYWTFSETQTCLNPCCGGRCSSTCTLAAIVAFCAGCLDPCCGGRCSSTYKKTRSRGREAVLILVVVKDVLVHISLELEDPEDLS